MPRPRPPLPARLGIPASPGLGVLGGAGEATRGRLRGAFGRPSVPPSGRPALRTRESSRPGVRGARQAGRQAGAPEKPRAWGGLKGKVALEMEMR